MESILNGAEITFFKTDIDVFDDDHSERILLSGSTIVSTVNQEGLENEAILKNCKWVFIV